MGKQGGGDALSFLIFPYHTLVFCLHLPCSLSSAPTFSIPPSHVFNLPSLTGLRGRWRQRHWHDAKRHRERYSYSYIKVQCQKTKRRKTCAGCGLKLWETCRADVAGSMLCLFSNTFPSVPAFSSVAFCLTSKFIFRTKICPETSVPSQLSPGQKIRGRMKNLHGKCTLLQNLLESLHEDFLTLCWGERPTICKTSDRSSQ